MILKRILYILNNERIRMKNTFLVELQKTMQDVQEQVKVYNRIVFTSKAVH